MEAACTSRLPIPVALRGNSVWEVALLERDPALLVSSAVFHDEWLRGAVRGCPDVRGVAALALEREAAALIGCAGGVERDSEGRALVLLMKDRKSVV